MGRHRRPVGLLQILAGVGGGRVVALMYVHRCWPMVSSPHHGHAPGQWRALTVRNIDAWYETFKVAEGQKLYLKPEERVKIW